MSNKDYNDQEEQNLPELEHTEDELNQDDPIQMLEEELKELNDKHLRLYSEFDNFRKRSMKERLELIKTASEDVVLSLLPIVDDFERALTSIKDKDAKAGVKLIFHKFQKTLESKGLQPIETIGQPFDADIAEAVAQMPVEDKKQKGMVIDEVQKGYKLNDKVIRHSKVVVGI